MDRKPSDAVDALSTVRILDIGTMIACNYASALMGDFAAQVIKIELPRMATRCDDDKVA
jgi:crotonobetainyl-CoA:carnitine CoA-transferase CaiB-like acyl-CoA transferase